MSDLVELTNELKTLRRGEGLQASRLADQVGPVLRELAGITSDDDTAAIRAKLTRQLSLLAEGLPEDLRLVVVTALALNPDTQHQFLLERVQSLADRQQQDVRVIRRSMEEAFELLAQIAARPAAEQPRGAVFGWHTERFEAILRLDKDLPECFERRRIVAEQDGLETIQQSVTVPRIGLDPDDDDLNCQAQFGIAVLGRYRKPGNRFVFDLELPEPLSIGQKHEYGLIWRMPDIQRMRTHYVVFPDRRCDELDIRIHFAPGRLPRVLWRMEAIYHREIDNELPRTPLTLDKLGEIHVTFRNLMPGHGYGIQWVMEEVWDRTGEAQPHSADPIVSVYVDTYDDERVTRIWAALTELLEGEGLYIELVGEPEVSSWFGRFKIKAKEALTKDEIASRLQKVEHAIEVASLHRPMSEANANHADAASKLVQAANEYDAVVMLVGSVMLVKFTSGDGKKRLVVKTLSVAEVRMIENNTHVLKDPQAALAYLDRLADGSQQSNRALAEAAQLSAAPIAYRRPPTPPDSGV